MMHARDARCTAHSVHSIRHQARSRTMRNTSSNRSGRSRRPLYIATLVALLGAGSASAVDLTGVAVNPDGSMAFPNVRVVNAPQLATAAVAAPAQPGLRAYIDTATGELRGPTQAELNQQALDDQIVQQLSAQSLGFQERSATVRADGSMSFTLDESSLVYTVVRKADNGEIDMACVVGPEQAAKLLYLKSPSLNALRREARNDR
jgi:hypothetical protein